MLNVLALIISSKRRFSPLDNEGNQMKTVRILLVLCFLGVAIVMNLFARQQVQAALSAKDTATLSYEDEINKWHQKHIAGLKAQGWLSLVGLDWLDEGRNSIKSLGTLTLDKGTATLQVRPEVQPTVGGNPFRSGIVHIEVGNDKPDRIEVGSRASIIIKVGDRYALRTWDSNAETLKDFTGIDRFPVSKRWRIEARWEPYASPKTIKFATVVDGYLEDHDVPGAAVFTVTGQEFKLEPVSLGPKRLILIFADKTNGKETYGAGRFLFADPPNDGKLVIDFNKSFNPPCAFSPYATCPLPPASNRLPTRIEAGEMNFTYH